jgi:anhydro-N-acetylmuramic acid kinase
VGDRLLFSDYDFCLNLGGFSNISYDKAGQRMAFDIGPVNIILNLLSQRLNKPYDEGGKMAAIGKLDVVLFRELNDLAYYRQGPPKSLGMEWVEKHVLPMMHQDTQVENLLHTFTRHAALQIAHAILGSGLEGESIVLVTGGGAYNEFLLKNITDYTGDKVRLIVPDQKLIDFKEALIFGFLGLLKKLGETNVDAEVTGANRNTSGGVFYSA